MRSTHKNPLTASDMDHLSKFIGYGNLNADVWFIGMEEAGGGEENIRTRLTFKKVEDCFKAHEKLGINKHHLDRKIIQPTWAQMCRLMLGLENKPFTTTNVRQYQSEQLGRNGGNTLLCELMPIPKPNITSWGYENFIPHFQTVREYYQQVKPLRIKYFKKLLSHRNPKIVICYGKKYWKDYKNIFEDRVFEVEGEFQIATNKQKTIILTPHLISRQMNGQISNLVDLVNCNLR